MSRPLERLTGAASDRSSSSARRSEGRKKTAQGDVLGGGPTGSARGSSFDYLLLPRLVLPLRGDGLRHGDGEQQTRKPSPPTTDTSDRLYFEPHPRGRAFNVHRSGRPEGVIVQFGGRHRSSSPRAPAALAGHGRRGLPPHQAVGHLTESIGPGRRPRAVSRHPAPAEIRQPRKRPGQKPLTKQGGGGRRPPMGYPGVVRPSYVLGGRAMGKWSWMKRTQPLPWWSRVGGSLTIRC